MKILLENLLEHSFVISINKTRLDFFWEQWKNANLPGLPRHVAGIQIAKNNCGKSINCKKMLMQHISVMSTHLMVVSMAQALQLPYVCVFEDDAVGCIDVRNRFQEVADNLPDDSDLVALGNTWKTGAVKKFNDLFAIPRKIHGLHSYIVFQKNYDYFIDHMTVDYSSGLMGYGEHAYLCKDILFCQYNLGKSLGRGFHRNHLGYIHNSLPKDYIESHFPKFGK